MLVNVYSALGGEDTLGFFDDDSRAQCLLQLFGDALMLLCRRRMYQVAGGDVGEDCGHPQVLGRPASGLRAVEVDRSDRRPFGEQGMPATARIPAVLAALAYSGQRWLVSPSTRSDTVIGCDVITASTQGPRLVIFLDAFKVCDRFYGSGDESLLEVVGQGHPRAGQVDGVGDL
jgi:hypothetical protein